MAEQAPPTKEGVRKSVVVTVITRYSMLVISTIATMILARLLTPAEIGVFSLAAIFVNLAHSVRGFGVGQYIVQEIDLTTDRIRSAFGITLVIAWTIAIVLILLSPLASKFYGEPGVGSVLRVLALNFAIIPFGSVLLALVNREMRFDVIFRISVLSELFRHSSSVVLAWMGFGPLSLAWGAVVGVGSTVLLTQIFAPQRLKVRPGFKEWRRVLNFGGSATLAAIAKDLQEGSPELVIGRAMNTSAVGFFGKAIAVNKLFDRVVLSAVRPAVLPHMSAKHRAGESIRGFYAHGLSLITALAWPFYAFVAVFAFPMIRVLYGNQWDAAVPLARLLCIYAAVDVIFAFAGQALVAVGAVSRLVRLRITVFAATIMVVVATVSLGLETVALAMVIPSVIGLIYSYKLLNHAMGLRVRDYAQAIIPGLVITAGSIALPWIFWIRNPLQWENPVAMLIIGMLGSAVGWLLTAIVMKHPIWEEVARLFAGFTAKVRSSR